MVGFARNLVEIVPRSLPELFKQLGDQNNSQKHKKMKIENQDEIIGGVHDLQILSRQNAIECSRNLPGCLPVARKRDIFKGINKETIDLF